MLSGDLSHCVFPITLPEGEKTLSVLTLPESEKTPCVQSPQEGQKTRCVQSQDISKQVQFKSVYIQEKVKDLPVGDRLRQFLPEWEKRGSHRLITGLIRDGYKLLYTERPNLSGIPCIISSYAGFRQTKCLMDLYSRSAAERCSRSRSYPRKSGFLQLSLPGSKTRQPQEASHRLKLGHFLAVPKFKMETPESIRASLRKGEWVSSIDLTDAYLHVPIHSQSQKYLRFHFKGVTYQFTSLPFRLATAPLIFTSIVKEIKLIALQSGISIHQYLDGWLIRAPSEQQCMDQTQKLLKMVKDLGFIVNLKKSELKPSQRFDFLCYHFLLDLAIVKPTQDRWTKLQEMFHRLSMKSVISARTLMSTIGLLASTEKTVKLGRMHMRPFQWHLKVHWKYPMPLDTLIPWNQKMIRHGEWWLDPQNVLQGEHLHPREHKKLIFTDASNAGWGAHLGKNSTGGLWSLSEKHLYINLLEMKAVLLALQFFKAVCRNNQVLIASENTSVVAYISKQGGTKSAELCALMWRILTWCHQNKVTLRARHVPGSLNVIADGLSRRNQIQSTEWSLSPQIFKQISKLWESPQVDLFATSLNKKLPTYVCPILDPQAWAVVPLNIPWQKLGCLRFSSHRPAAQGCTKISITNMQDNSDSPRLTNKTMVLGPGGVVPGHSKTTTTHTHSAKTATQQPLPCQPNIPEPPCLVSRSSALQEHGFIAEVAERIAAPQRLSTRSIYTSKWTVFR